MARPSKYTEEDYRTGFQNLLDYGLTVREIKATALQKEVGGRYALAVEMLDKLKTERVKEQESKEKVPPMSDLYSHFASEFRKQTEILITDSWPAFVEAQNGHKSEIEASFLEEKAVIDEQLNAEIEQKEDSLARVAELEGIELKLGNMTTAFNQSEQAKGQLQVRLEEALRREESLEQQQVMIAGQRDDALKDKAELTGQLETTSAELKEAKTQADKLHTENGELTQTIVDLEKDLKTTTENSIALEKSKITQGLLLEKLTGQIEQKDTQIEKLDTVLQDTQQSAIGCRESLSGVQSTLASRDERVKELLEELKELKKDNRQMTKEIGKLDGQLASIKKPTTKTKDSK